MDLFTTRFGTIEVDESKDVLTFPEGLIGFSEYRRYVLIPHGKESPFQWLQSLDDPNLAFVVIDPLCILPDYRADVEPKDVKPLELKDAGEAKLLVIVVVPPEGYSQIRANLRGPIVINTRNNRAMQLVLSDEYPLRYYLFQEEEGCGNACSNA